MFTLIRWTLLRLARRKYPEMFDPALALENVLAAIEETTRRETR